MSKLVQIIDPRETFKRVKKVKQEESYTVWGNLQESWWNLRQSLALQKSQLSFKQIQTSTHWF